jgi:gamma-glutamyltranspeptidase / glutathione hydrolase
MSNSPNRRRFLKQSTALAALGLASNGRASVASANGMVNGQREAAEAGNAILAAGGNAVDAAVGAALVAGVVAVHSTGIGGYGGHMMIATPGAKATAIDFNSMAPAAFNPDIFPRDAKGAVIGGVNNHGWLAAGVPGVLAGLQLSLDRFGTKQFAELAKPAIRIAREGFPVPRGLAGMFKREQQRLAKDPGTAKLLLRNGEPFKEGETFRNPELADLLQSLAEAGRVDAFYTGAIAAKIAEAFRKNGGLVTADDLAAYRAVETTPLSFEWKGFVIHTPPPTSGGLTVLQMLAAMKALGSIGTDPNDPAMVHARVEAQRIAWSDRLRLLGDPKHVEVPVDRLLSEQYARESGDRAMAVVKSNKMVEGRSDGRSAGGTIHLNAVDASGMMVALTYTHGNAFGAQVTVDGLGLTLGHGMSRFDPVPGRANSPGPRKRPLHNMCPTVVTKDGVPVFTLGATGGRLIVNTVFDVLNHQIGESLGLSEAVKAPRIHTEGDHSLLLNLTWPAGAVERLKRVGYTIRTGGTATLHAIERDCVTGEVKAAAR